MARPSKYTPTLAERICKLIAQGKSKRQIGEMPDMPHRDTINAWLLRHEEFSGQYARACEVRAEAFAEEIVEIADTEEDAAKARVRIDARKWVACKLLPKVYGEKIDHNHAGSVSYTIVTGVDGGLDGGRDD